MFQTLKLEKNTKVFAVVGRLTGICRKRGSRGAVALAAVQGKEIPA